MLRIASLSLLMGGCISTIDLPLETQHVLRPRAATQATLSLQVGVVESPDMTNTLDEVKDSRGALSNPSDGSVLFGDSKNSGGVFDLGFETKNSFAFGVSSARGIYGLYDYLSVENWALSLTASYLSYSESDSQTTQIVGEPQPLTDKFSGRSFTTHVAHMISYKFPVRSVAFYPYLSLGLNRTYNTLKVNSQKAHSIDLLPTVVLGLYFDAGWGQIALEEGLVLGYRERGEKARAERSQARLVGLNFSL